VETVAGAGTKKSAAKVSAAVIVEPGSKQSRYLMFEVAELTPQHAVLRGPLLLEAGEPLTLELGFGDGTTLQVPVAVEEVLLGDSEVRVRFERTSDSRSIERKLGIAG